MNKKTYGTQDIATLIAVAIHDISFSRFKKEDIQHVEKILKSLEVIDEAYQQFTMATGNVIQGISKTDVSPYLPFDVFAMRRPNQKVAAGAYKEEGMKILKDMEKTYLFFKHQHRFFTQVLKIYNQQIEDRNKANDLQIPDSPVQEIPAE